MMNERNQSLYNLTTKLTENWHIYRVAKTQLIENWLKLFSGTKYFDEWTLRYKAEHKKSRT